ncbi:MAG: hypothetical protein K9H25_05845 [Rhodospirillum sp.]|nr:hypothetical protein [Rhodospirillum sp.]MCF8490232.1 hypothetical protein [Rhodospirillum sp.]MCF8500991.1 hypothetical protein [Rhodospirillum sp.]
MPRFVLPLAITGALALGACTAQQCDPTQVRNVATSLACTATGGFSANLDQVRNEVATLRREKELTQAERQEMESQAQSLAKNRSALERVVADQRGSLQSLDLELSALEGNTDRQAAQIQVLEQELARAKAELEHMDDPGVSAAEITQLRESVEERKRLIEAYLATVRQE